MDALIYTAMSGAERALRAQQVHANNLANLDTSGFQADMELATSQTVSGFGYDARHLNKLQANGVSAREGTAKPTGRDLDVALQGGGYLTVQYGASEAYTRAGQLQLAEDGALTVNGRPVMGEGGPIVLPPYRKLEIASDGSISIQPAGEEAMQVVDKLKLVKPEAKDVVKNEAGLIVSRRGDTLESDDSVRVHGGFVEGSNVGAVEEMVATMTLNRDFEIQMKLFHAADSMADSGNRLIRD
ncbi:flagellar basal body rod protein FlgF [Ideonella azotifigens]|uniref:Flagellar basal-body rod protein FlgF n=1 Tax=Ideonella azotifigens TaxID=513160 RepID=A0ABP3VL96_9BURK|nr:flagellar basal body rod protein FlgF [Ideonella azotifigens]MCD2339095.1 flagellar basal body rod protein FlgF [Ideonella azotifigens]